MWIGVTYRNVLAFCLLWSVASVLGAEIGQPWLDSLVMRGNSHYFVAGIAFYLIHRHGPRLELWLLIGLSWAQSIHYYQGNPLPADKGLSYAPSSLLITGCFGVLALLSLHRLDWIRWRRLAVLGTATYPFYLLHYAAGFAAIHFVRGHTTIGPVPLLVLTLAVLTGLAILVSRRLEQPIARRLRSQLDHRGPRLTLAEPPGRDDRARAL